MQYQLDDYLKESVEKENRKEIKVDLSTTIMQYKSNRVAVYGAIKYVEDNYGIIYEADNGENELKGVEIIEKKHFPIILTNLKYNFSKERVERALDVAEQIYGKYVEEEHKKTEKIYDIKYPIGGIIIGGIIGTFTGGIIKAASIGLALGVAGAVIIPFIIKESQKNKNEQ